MILGQEISITLVTKMSLFGDNTCPIISTCLLSFGGFSGRGIGTRHITVVSDQMIPLLSLSVVNVITGIAFIGICLRRHIREKETGVFVTGTVVLDVKMIYRVGSALKLL